MLRRLFTLLSVASLVLGTATCVLWARSYAGEDDWTLSADGADPSWWVSSEAGRLTVIRQSQAGDGPGEPTGFAFAGFAYLSSRTLMNVGVPHWAAAVVLHVPLIWWVGRGRRRSRRDRPGLCAGCGYDLRATPEGGGALLGRCPECGAVPTNPTRPV